MALMESPTYPASEIEALITALHGVMASSVVIDDSGRVEEIHVLARSRVHPKQIVRDIESALSAGLGLVVDRRAISVAQVRPDHDELVNETLNGGPDEPAPLPAPDTDESDIAGRFIFVGYDARTQPDLEAACRVSIRRGNSVYSGTGEGPSTPLGRAQAAARAVFAAIATARRADSIGIEGVTIVDSHGHDFVLVAAHAIVGRSSVPLTGIAALQKSPEEAAILAALQATNRWNEIV
jgi:hypothetical protein